MVPWSALCGRDFFAKCSGNPQGLSVHVACGPSDVGPPCSMGWVHRSCYSFSRCGIGYCFRSFCFVVVLVSYPFRAARWP
jgi:hypothetical protein